MTYQTQPIRDRLIAEAPVASPGVDVALCSHNLDSFICALRGRSMGVHSNLPLRDLVGPIQHQGWEA